VQSATTVGENLAKGLGNWMFLSIVVEGTRPDLFAGLTVGVLEEACRQRFQVVRSQHLEGASRWLFLMTRSGNPRMGKDAVRALSLANLLFLPVWPDIIDTANSMSTRDACLATVISVLVLALLFWVLVTLIRRSGNRLAFRLMQLALPLALLSPLNVMMRMVMPKQRPITALTTLGLAIAIISVFEARPWRRIICTSLAILTVMFPFFLVTFGQVSILLMHFTEKPRVPLLSSRNDSGPHVLWLLFDEMDQGMAFSNRPATLSLPELDRFRGQAVFALNAYPPGDRTMISVPALLTGELVTKARQSSPSEFRITLADSGEEVRWGRRANVFSRARSLGFNTALIGWHFPYGRIMGDSLTVCSWYGDVDALTLRETAFEQIETLVNTVPVAWAPASALGIMNNIEAKRRRQRLKHLNACVAVLEDTTGAALNSTLQLTFAHFPVPHGPCIFDRSKDDFRLDGESHYIDNLKLVDRTFGQLRRAMEEAGVWDDTIVLLTSDHPWRPSLFGERPSENPNNRVPFILKAAGQMQGLTYESDFNTVVTQDLLLALLKGEIFSPESVVEWLDGHRVKGDCTPRELTTN
jgi:Sulfatase